MNIRITSSQNILETGYITVGGLGEPLDLHITLSEKDRKAIKGGKAVILTV